MLRMTKNQSWLILVIIAFTTQVSAQTSTGVPTVADTGSHPLDYSNAYSPVQTGDVIMGSTVNGQYATDIYGGTIGPDVYGDLEGLSGYVGPVVGASGFVDSQCCGAPVQYAAPVYQQPQFVQQFVQPQFAQQPLQFQQRQIQVPRQAAMMSQQQQLYQQNQLKFQQELMAMQKRIAEQQRQINFQLTALQNSQREAMARSQPTFQQTYAAQNPYNLRGLNQIRYATNTQNNVRANQLQWQSAAARVAQAQQNCVGCAPQYGFQPTSVPALQTQGYQPPGLQVPPAGYQPSFQGAPSNGLGFPPVGNVGRPVNPNAQFGGGVNPYPYGVNPYVRQGSWQPLIPLRALPPGLYVGQGLIGQPVAYVNGEPVRNFLRYIFP